MRGKELFDFNYTLELPPQDGYPLNIGSLGRTVREILLQDIRHANNYTIITGFTSLANLIDIFGAVDYPQLTKLKVVIGYDPDERVSKRLPHYSLATEIKNFWLKQNVSIRLCGPIINLIQHIDSGRFDFRVQDKLHAKIYVGNQAAVLGSSNFSKSGIIFQTEANIRVQPAGGEKESEQYRSIAQIAEHFYQGATDYNKTLKELLYKLFRDATWQEALARAIAEILESKWMKDYPALYNALVNNELWPSQRIGIASAMRIIQDRGRVLIADPTGSGKTKFATALACTVFHWLWENGLRDRSNALIISPKQVIDNWEREQLTFSNLYNKIESMGRLSLSNEKIQKQLQKEISEVDILVVDEAHNYLRRGSIRSKAINPKGSTHVLLSTATPINKKAEDLLRLIELLDIDNLNDEDLKTYLQFRKKPKRPFTEAELNKLKSYINKFIVRRTKKELNSMIERDPDGYKNRLKNRCRYPKTITDSFLTGETTRDRELARQINELTSRLKGINYLKRLKIPDYIKKLDERKKYVTQRLNSGPALAAFMVHSALRSSTCALYEHLYGTRAAIDHYELDADKISSSGNVIATLQKGSQELPVTNFPKEWLSEQQQWLIQQEDYEKACADEIGLYEKIGELLGQFSGKREIAKATTLIEKAGQYHKILAFDSTVITLDYLKKLMGDLKCQAKILIASGQNSKNRTLIKEYFALENKADFSLIALCSDAMSEGINLPSAKALLLLDIPSVLRLIEQRIGRIERMDSEHETVHVYWPNDTDEFSLKGDKRMLDILVITENLIGNNVDIPQALYDRYLKDDPSAENFMHAYKEFVNSEEEWTGVRDSTQSLYQLYEGENPLIDHETYQMFKDVDASVKTAISFVRTTTNWSFFAFRGDARRSPKWLFIDERNKGITDFTEIAEKLKTALSGGKAIQRKWTEVDTREEMRKIMHKLRNQEYALLSDKKRRALKVAGNILRKKINLTDPSDTLLLEKMQKLQKLLRNEQDNYMEDYIDYNHFADLWLQILIPELDNLRNTRRTRTKIFTLLDLSDILIDLPTERIDWLLENSQYANTLDEIVAACIIGVQ